MLTQYLALRLFLNSNIKIFCEEVWIILSISSQKFWSGNCNPERWKLNLNIFDYVFS